MGRWFSRTLGASERAGRNFMVCNQCGRVVPAWRLLMTRRPPGAVIGCGCGSPYVKPAIIRAWRSVWWYFAVGLFWRRLVCRRENWDPRLPMRW